MEPRRSPKSAGAAPPKLPSAAPGPPPPGAFVPYLHGDFAAATLNNGSGAVTFNIFDWSVEARTITRDARGFGERYRRPVAVSSEWTFRARGYVTALSTAHAINSGFANDGADPPSVTVSVYSGTTGGTKIFEGAGLMVRGTLAAPDGAMAVQEIEIDGFGTPTTVV